MKNLKRIFSLLTVILVLTLALSTTGFAAKRDSYDNTVVLIETTIRYTSTNTGYAFEKQGTGTGFGLGLPGESVQYIGTASHVVEEPSGYYIVFLDASSGVIVDVVPAEDGSISETGTTEYNGRKCEYLLDYFKTENVELRAVFSNASNDFINLTVVQTNTERDVSVCKIAGSPTDKIKALPLQLRKDVTKNTKIVATGFASTSMAFNDEAKYDATDSTLKDGIISNIVGTKGNRGSNVNFEIYEVSADLTTGMSGGPVICEETGCVIGVTSFGVTDPSQAASSNYAVCIDDMVALMDAAGIKYKIGGESGSSALVIIIIAAGVALVAAAVVVIILVNKKKKAPKPAPYYPGAYADDKTYTPVTPVASAPKKFYLYGVSGPLAGQKFGVTDRAVIGRDKTKCNVVLPVDQPGVSGLHCEVKVSGGVMMIKDCASSYGTFLLNGTKLEPNASVMLESGAKFWVGTKEVVFEVRY